MNIYPLFILYSNILKPVLFRFYKAKLPLNGNTLKTYAHVQKVIGSGYKRIHS